MDLHNNSISGRKSGNSRLMNTNCKPWNKCPIRVFSGTAVPGWEECSFLMFLPFSHSNNIKFTCCLGWVSSWTCPPVSVLNWISSNYLQLSPTTLSPPPPQPQSSFWTVITKILRGIDPLCKKKNNIFRLIHVLY